jgi:hypothetical protein
LASSVDQASPGWKGTVVITVRLAALAALAVASYGQTRPQDVDGWDKVKWGMTLMEARSTYHVQAQPESNDNWTLLSLKPVKMGDVEMGVEVGARNGSQKITSVRLWSYFGVPNAAPAAGAQDFNTLKSVLIQEYGPPAIEDEKRGENFRLLKSVGWTFPSTSILLTLEQSASLPNLGSIYLDYTATGRKP